MILIHCPTPTSRHHFVFRLVFREWLGVEYRVNDPAAGMNTDVPQLIYGPPANAGQARIGSAGLLSENEIRTFVPETSGNGEDFCLFPVHDREALLSFDVFSAIFWMLSRYEEYLPWNADEHGRFEANQSLMYQHGMHRFPVVDRWVNLLYAALHKRYPHLVFHKKEFEFLPTYDIDQAWSYRNKGFFRNLAGGARDLLTGKFDLLSERAAVLLGKRPDPFDSFAYQATLHQQHQLKPIYFIHPGTYGKYDKNVSLKHPQMAALLHSLEAHARIGLHPSYRAAVDPGLLQQEIEIMADVSGQPVTRIRNHFLRIRIPETYRRYHALGILEDYSIGWATDSGFRAGTSRCFPFYDLNHEEETGLMLHPLSMMDGAYRNYRQQSPEEALTEAAAMIRQLRQEGGRLITLWHNESLGTSPRWTGWREMYEQMITLCKP